MQECFLLEIMPLSNTGQMPSSLPQNLIFKGPNQKTWKYMDKVCDKDCSDESGKTEDVILFYVIAVFYGD